MPYRAMALVAASLLFATQCYAAVKLNASRSNIYRAGSTTSGGGAGKEGSVHIRAVPEGGGAGVRAKNSTSGGGTGKPKALNEPLRGGQGVDFPGRR